MNTSMNTKIVLNARPKGAPRLEDFRLEQTPLAHPAAGQVLLRTVFLSLDPYMRGRMNDAPSYAPSVQIGEAMVGGTVSRVEVSRHPSYAAGDWVVGGSGWQSFALSDGSDISPLDERIRSPSHALGVLGMPGFTAYHGLLNIGRPQPGETIVVASAAGAVGSVVGQIGRLQGARVIGIAGGPEKCRYARETLGFDVCIDHRASDFAAQLAAAARNGIDVYFENVGGGVFQAVLPLLNQNARVPVCGLIAHYNDTELPPGPDRVPLLMRQVLTRRLLVQGFLIFDHFATGREAFVAQMSRWVDENRITVHETFLTGLPSAPQGLIDLLAGRHLGKVIVQVSDP
jgi:NADPH-dependent curcumin reductase CurA